MPAATSAPQPTPALPALPELRCPACGAELELAGASAPRCRGCAREFGWCEGLLDLRLAREPGLVPDPMQPGDARGTLARLAAGEPFRSALEQLLIELPAARGDRIDLLLRECRGAWLLLLRERGGRALFLGNPLSGTVVGLASLGFEVVVLDPAPERLALAQARNQWSATGRCVSLVGGDGPRLPFADASFACVVQEENAPEALEGRGYGLAECARVCAGELALVADNRLGYKRSTGRKAAFRIPGPLEYARSALAPGRGLRTLAGYRRALARSGAARTQAFALYPHQRDFAFTIAIDEPLPRLAIGPKERRNRLKVAAQRSGLFPLFAPSFLVCAERVPRAPLAMHAQREPRAALATRIGGVLAELAERLREPEPQVEQLVATRGNTALVHTCVPGRDERDPAGRWTLHVTISPLQGVQARMHYARLLELRERFPGVPVPEPLHCGELGGLFLTCERRLPGLTAPQYAGDERVAARMLADACAHLAQLAVGAPRALDEREFEQLVDAKFEWTLRSAQSQGMRSWLAAQRVEARARMIGLVFPRVLYHSDLRSKHVQVEADGRVLGYLDWGSSESSDLPYFDPLHLLVHERKQAAGVRPAEAWRTLRERSARRPEEERALAAYCEALGLSEEYRLALEAIYPVLVSAMAARNWEYGRPHWLERSFGLQPGL